MKKVRLILSLSISLISLISLLVIAPQASAACNYPAYCDAAPGTCATGNVCNGGNQCVIGETVCSGSYPDEESAQCSCSGGTGPLTRTCNTGNTGLSCRAATAYSGAGICTCQYEYTCGVQCIDRPQSGCCSGGTGCGWTNWGACSVACGGGTQSRSNTCNGTIQTQACNTQACPVPTPSPAPPGNPTPNPSPVICNWGPWSACSASCGGGTRTRTDNCGNTSPPQACNTHDCVTCTVGTWSGCSAACGVGIETRPNTCAPAGVETRSCDTCTAACACTLACGQSTQCGTCSGAEFGTPGAITLNPASGNVTMPSNRSITLSWTAASLADNYDIQVFPTGTTPGQECTAPNTFCATGLTSTGYTFTAPQGVPNYEWRVRANNTTCSAVTFGTATASDEYLISEGAPYDMTADLVFDGDDGLAWNAGGFPPGWIEVDLQRTRTVSGVRLATNHFPAGNAVYQIYGGATPNPATLIDTVNEYINPGDVLNITFSAPVANVRYMRIVVSSSTSWAGFGEITPYYTDGIANWTNGAFTLVGPVAGNIYLDQNFNAALNLATGLCEMSGPLTGQNPGGAASVQATWQSGGSATGSIAGSAYTVNNVLNYNNIGVQLSPDASAWRCTCPFGCTYSGQDVPTSGVNFFIANVAQPWWQTQNGLVYAGSTTGNALVSQIPALCTGDCIDDFSLRNSYDASESSGIVITGGGDIDVDPDPALRYTKLRQEANQAHVVGSVYNGPRENYQYFYNLYSMGSSPTVDFNGEQPSSDPANGRAYYATGTININSPWTLGTEPMVIFINGNLNINSTITVPQGGFLAFIVNGNITVANTVGVDNAPVVVPSPVPPSNVAVGKASSQSSTYPLPNSEAANVNDGDTNGDFNAGSVNHTLNDVNAWWQVDLGGTYDIDQINIYNRTDGNASRLTNYHVLVSDAPFTSTSLAPTLAQSGVTDYPNAGTAGTPSTVNVNRTGRYVRIQLDGQNYLHLAELEVIGTPVAETSVNVAIGKPSSQSSTYPLPNSEAARVNDGDIDGNHATGSTNHTLNDANAWWQVDLGASYDIDEIRVYNRTDANVDRLTNYHVLVSDDPFASTNLASTLSQAGVSNYANTGTAGRPSTVAVGRSGRYVRIQLAGTNYLHLAELEVMVDAASAGAGGGAVEGVYIGDRIIIQGGLAGGDKQFVGAGTFVGWTSVTLGREYDDPFTNDSYPTELFIFRPDFVSNIPERMTRPLYSWQETN